MLEFHLGDGLKPWSAKMCDRFERLFDGFHSSVLSPRRGNCHFVTFVIVLRLAINVASAFYYYLHQDESHYIRSRRKNIKFCKKLRKYNGTEYKMYWFFWAIFLRLCFFSQIFAFLSFARFPCCCVPFPEGIICVVGRAEEVFPFPPRNYGGKHPPPPHRHPARSHDVSSIAECCWAYVWWASPYQRDWWTTIPFWFASIKLVSPSQPRLSFVPAFRLPVDKQRPWETRVRSWKI